MSEPADPAQWTCPLPLRDYTRIVLGHGGGGQLSAELVEHLFVPAFGGATLAELGDAAVVDVPSGRLVLTTDSFVVRPLFFPGGTSAVSRCTAPSTTSPCAAHGRST